MSAFYTIRDRWVLTYQPERWPLGFITGYPEGETFVVEHVVNTSGVLGVTLAMMRAGLEEAWARGFTSVRFHVPHAYPPAAALAEIGRRLGFVEQWRTEDAVYFVRQRAAA